MPLAESSSEVEQQQPTTPNQPKEPMLRRNSSSAAIPSVVRQTIRSMHSEKKGACGCNHAPEQQHGQRSIQDLLDNNKRWATAISKESPQFFTELAKQQTPEFLWIGCSDSRVPANQVIDLPPGEVFVHRNIANVVVPSDLNCLAVIQFAVEHLKVKHIIVNGHYGCGGVKAALLDQRLGLADNWTRHVRDIHRRHTRRIEKCGSVDAQHDLLCELNVVQQMHNVAETTIVRDAWANGSALEVHGWIYGLSDGIVKPLVSLNRHSDKYTLETTAKRIIRNAHEKAGVADEE